MDEPRLAIPGRTAGRASHRARTILWLALLLALPYDAHHVASEQVKRMAMPSEATQLPAAAATPGLGEPNLVDQERRLRLLNVKRQQSIISDTNKLLKLATELNAEVHGANSGSLTSAQLRKVVEIEKLAHRVKEGMNTPAWGTPPAMEPFTVPRSLHP